VRFAKHDDVVETFAADRADESLNVSILPERSGCDRTVPNAHGTDPLQEDWTIRGVSIPNESETGAGLFAHLSDGRNKGPPMRGSSLTL
jgi:hypothetical protein